MRGVTQPGRKVSYERGLLTETSMLSRVGQGKGEGEVGGGKRKRECRHVGLGGRVAVGGAREKPEG